jgi:hypothetical protein
MREITNKLLFGVWYLGGMTDGKKLQIPQQPKDFKAQQILSGPPSTPLRKITYQPFLLHKPRILRLPLPILILQRHLKLTQQLRNDLRHLHE